MPYWEDVYSEREAREVLEEESSLKLFIKGEISPYENCLPVSMQNLSDVPPERWLQFDDVKMERSLSGYRENDKYPIPSPSDREGYFGDRHYHYWLSGLKDYLFIKQVLSKNGYPLRASSGVLDLGCASGRVLRHFLCQESNLELWAVDIKLRHVEWIRRFLAPSLRVFPNTILPHLPLEDNAFSLVYAFSVFTHIDELELAWLAEIRRILKKGGIAYLTVHSDHTWKNIESARPLYDNLLAMKEYIHGHKVTPELFKEPMPAEKTVFSWTTASIYNSNVFHSIGYINNVWGRFLEIVDVIKEGHSYQDVIVLRKK
jgi:SAM-dependent methyltransferase